MTPEGSRVSSRFTKRKLLENVVFGAMGVAFTVMAAGGVSNYAITVTDQFSARVAGATAGMVTFSMVDITALGKGIDAKLRGLRLLTGAAVLVSLVLLTAAVRHSASTIPRQYRRTGGFLLIIL